MNKWAQEKPELDKAREQRGICFIPDDDLGYVEIIYNATRKLEIKKATAMLCKVTTAANRTDQAGGDLVQVNGSKMDSSCAEKNHEDMIMESQRIRMNKESMEDS